MLILIAGLLIFLGAHSLPILASRRAALVERLGAGAYKGLMSLAAFVGLVLIVWGFAEARSEGAIVLWSSPKALKHITLLLMLPVFPLLIAAYVPGRIGAVLKHPMITAVKLWAFAHLLSNGTLPDLLLFGSFLAWGVIDRISLKRRPSQSRPPVPSFGAGDAIAIVLGLVLYGLMLWRGHLFLIGVSPL